MKFETRLVQFDPCPGDPHRPSATPIYQTSTFEIREGGAYDYTRSGNPTRTVLEAQLAHLEGGRRALCFASGMAAISAVARFVQPGERIVAGLDLYGGTSRLLSQVLPVRVEHVDTTDLAAVERALGRGARLMIVETPSNPLMRISDLRALVALCHRYETRLAVDNSLLSPWGQRPLEFGVDVVIHSATKHLAGHGDVTGGVVIGNDEAFLERVAFVRNAEGTALAPFESWLLLRGLQTLSIRQERACATACTVARMFQDHPAVERVFHPSLERHAGHALHHEQASSAGSVISVALRSREGVDALLTQARLFTTTVSFGSVHSSVSEPVSMSHASAPKRLRSLLPHHLVRLSIGLEDPDDLIEDLTRALDSVAVTAGQT